VQLVAEAGRPPLRLNPEKSAETFWILASLELHHLLRVDLGWTTARYQAWLTDALQTLLMPARDGAPGGKS
jgi:hypothetical protein